MTVDRRVTRYVEWYRAFDTTRCAVFDCGKPVHACELCEEHYAERRRARRRELAAERRREAADS